MFEREIPNDILAQCDTDEFEFRADPILCRTQEGAS